MAVDVGHSSTYFERDMPPFQSSPAICSAPVTVVGALVNSLGQCTYWSDRYPAVKHPGAPLTIYLAGAQTPAANVPQSMRRGMYVPEAEVDPKVRRVRFRVVDETLDDAW